ncbi:M48 family metallopeptidase [Thalassotalea euphylliae]|uniref:M48 family peptidase n=1 Tax=Thalassotalea euphylliae TaxID=1655234 RepID=A0A3E0U2S2_9GAMM|nr:SprT family zinc-dependent metalloprotease [Thalassotalea euphylliae]REL30505.1 M48 family peptidase [Thalassotalea euphylliae]
MTANLQTGSSGSLSYRLIYSDKRKTIGLQVKHGLITVRAPSFVDKTFVERFVASKASWLRAKVSQQHNTENRLPRYRLMDGGRMLFMGKEFDITVQTGRRSSIDLGDEAFSFKLPSSYFASSEDEINSKGTPSKLTLQLEKQLDQWLKEQALKYLPERVRYWSSITNLLPQEVLIRKYKSRWGSCTSRGVVSLNSRLMLCPVEVVDYVIIHELCHLVHLNHSAKFWQLVDRHCPDMEQAKYWLKQNQREFYF